jgi:hypothetical protein
MQFFFPADITAHRDYIAIIAEQEVADVSFQELMVKTDLKMNSHMVNLGYAILPIPANIQEGMIHNWNVTSGLTEEFQQKLEDTFGRAGIVWNSAKKTLSRSGVHLDPHYLQTYEGTAPRTFDMEWAFIPQNKDEADTLRNMIKTFKGWASPQPDSAKIMIQQPATWKLKFSTTVEDMIRFTDMVVTNISVNYAPNGYSDFFNDGFPKQVNLSISFAERRTTYREHWLGEGTY